MAQVTHSPTVQEGLHDKIDHYLDFELGAWQSVPEYAERWSEMDPIDKEAFHLHWKGVTEAYLQELKRWAAAALLDSNQLAKYKHLQALIAQRRPMLDDLLSE